MRRRTIITIAALAAATSLAGCRSTNYRLNPTPKLQNLSMTQDEIDNRLTIVNDTNFRTMSDDAGRFLLLDRPRPSRPGPPVPY